ncbi:hypothetical protein Bbelb_364340 [Branchiostoma belcheri]|nr:hypothetical protein Bbelb_364340 [Branchiostoma belcheri]
MRIKRDPTAFGPFLSGGHKPPEQQNPGSWEPGCGHRRVKVREQLRVIDRTRGLTISCVPTQGRAVSQDVRPFLETRQELGTASNDWCPDETNICSRDYLRLKPDAEGRRGPYMARTPAWCISGPWQARTLKVYGKYSYT